MDNNELIIVYYFLKVDSDIIDGVKRFFSPNEPKKDFVDPYAVFSFAGRQVKIKFK